MDKKIGIFQLEWPFQIHTYNLIKSLAREGFVVDVFLYKTRFFEDIHEWEFEKDRVHINIINPLLTYPQIGSFFEKKRRPLILKRILNLLPFFSNYLNENVIQNVLYWVNSDKYLIHVSNIQKTLEIVHGKKYLCFIGIEKMGLIWSGKVAEKMSIPTIYYNLELYTHNHPYIHQSNRNKRIKKAEEYYHKLCCATIIQDEMRAKELYKDNKINADTIPPIYLPVSNLGETIQTKSVALQRRYNLKNEDVIVFYYGVIGKTRKTDQLMKISLQFPDHWKLILHGIDEMDADTFIRENCLSDKIILSKNILPFNDLLKLIKSATIGLVIYENTTMNDMLTAFSSEKLSTYLQCGLPIIAFRYPGYEIIDTYQCGILIHTVNDIPSAIRIILSRYEEFKQNAFRCFEDNYHYSKNFRVVKNFLDTIDRDNNIQ